MSINERLSDDAKTLQDRVNGHDTWIAEHDGRINVFWEQQHKLNPQTEKRLKVLEMDSTKFKAGLKSGWFVIGVIALVASSILGMVFSALSLYAALK